MQFRLCLGFLVGRETDTCRLRVDRRDPDGTVVPYLDGAGVKAREATGGGFCRSFSGSSSHSNGLGSTGFRSISTERSEHASRGVCRTSAQNRAQRQSDVVPASHA